MKVFILLLLLLCSFDLIAENIGKVIFKDFKAETTLNILKSFSFYNSYGDRNIIGVKIFIAPKNKNTDLNISLNINNKIIKKHMSHYRPSDYEEFKILEFNFNPVKQNNLKKFEIDLSHDSAITKLILVFDELPTSDFIGSAYEIQIDRLEELIQQNLYEENNHNSIDKFTRAFAAEELIQYPSSRAALLLVEIINYEGVWVDHDLRRICKKSIKFIIDSLIINFGEYKAVALMEEIEEVSEDFILDSFIINRIFDFESSAGLYFAINRHIYSPTDRSIGTDEILESIYKKDDFHEYVKEYSPKIISKIFSEFNDNNDWDQSRACKVFTKSPQEGILKNLLPYVKNTKFSLMNSCSNAILASTEKYDIKIEILPFEEMLIKIITEPYKKPVMNGNFFDLFKTGFSNDLIYRALAARLLCKIQTIKAKDALTYAINNIRLNKSEKTKFIKELACYE